MSFENGIIDLRSDTVTRPTDEMRAAMASAPVGDDVYEEDPVVNQLQELAAERVGKEAALFVPSGTMGNLIAVMVQCSRGDEAIMGHLGHTFLHEVGGISALGGVFPHVIPNQVDGTLSLDDIRSAYREEDIHHPVSKLLILENTQNQCGGLPLSADYMRSAFSLACGFGMKVHLDGARIFNAALALEVSPEELCTQADSVMFCLSKGLCAPVGSMLCGEKEFIKTARKIRKQLGGGMRQAGIIAAAGIIALEKMVERLVEDHQRAKLLAQGLEKISSMKLIKGFPPTNMVFVGLTPAVKKSPFEIKDTLKQENILIGISGNNEFRLVTHFGVNDEDIEKTISIFSRVLAN